MKSKDLKKAIIPTVYLMAVMLVLGAVYLTFSGINRYFKEKEEFDYAINGLSNTPIKAVQAEEVNQNLESIIKPYKSEKVSIGRYFYDFEGDSSNQENAIIYYENTYMQNTGVDYISEETFEVVSVLPGVVKSVETDEILGNIVKVESDKNILSVYEGIDNVTVKVNDKVTQGQVIATSGTSNINSKFNSSLHFEVYYKGEIMNPETFYTLKLSDL